MILESGTRLGSYEIVSPLGAGGMGEVYRAHDTRLNRDVALKILPDALIDADRLARFRREAQIVAALNHPNIAAIYGLEEGGERLALVLELVEGPTLAERIAQGPLSEDDTIAIARQIADALEAAHEQGIVHRDLKPANVKLRPDGVVKVLDFGLAKLSESTVVSSRTDPTLSPTLTSPAMTGVGVILGTAAYMAPEQAAGKVADKRADIWSFGVVVWEMLTGERLFGSAETTSHVLADVLRAPIDAEKIPAGPLRELLRRCLDRDVKTRLRDIGEARVALGRPVTHMIAPTRAASGRTTAALIAAVAVLAISTVVALWAPWRAEPERPLVRLDVDLGADVALPASTLTRNVILSPDGTRLLYIASVGGNRNRLYIRRLEDDRDKVIELAGTDGVTTAAFSPDSNSVAFTVGNRVYRVSAAGGAAMRLAETERPSVDVTWGEGENIIVSAVGSGLRRIPAGGGQPIAVTEISEGELVHGSTHVLPGGRYVLFSATRPGADVTPIEAVPVGGGDRKVIVASGLSPYYVPTGHLLYLLRDTLFAIRFDPDTLETNGDAVALVTGIGTTLGIGSPVGNFSADSKATLVYRRAVGSSALGTGAAGMRVDVIDAKGVRSPFIATPGVYSNLRFSPDGNRLAFTVRRTDAVGGGANVWVHDPARGSTTQLSFDGGFEPSWRGPDGRYMVFSRADGVFWMRPGSGGQPQRLLPLPAILAWSFPFDGSQLAYYMPGQSDGRGLDPLRARIFTVPVTEHAGALKAGTPQPFSPVSPFAESEAEFSPDGRWMAFSTDKSGGRLEVMVRAYTPDASGQRFETQVSINGGSEPRWSRTTQELLYVENDRLMAVSYAVKGDLFVPQRPRVKLEKLGSSEWDLARDGRIVVATPIGAELKPAADHTVVFLQNFFDEVHRRVK